MVATYISSIWHNGIVPLWHFFTCFNWNQIKIFRGNHFIILEVGNFCLSSFLSHKSSTFTYTC